MLQPTIIANKKTDRRNIKLCYSIIETLSLCCVYDLLQVYFELDWSSSVDLLQDIAFRAGMMLCDVAMRQPFAEQDPLMTLGCQLLNANAQFGQNYECRPLPKRGRLDMDKCEQPEGQGTGPDVMPMSFYIVRKPMNKVSRRARVRRA